MKTRLVSIIALFAYCGLLIKVMVFKDLPTIKIGQLMLNFGGSYEIHPANLIPFTTIVPYLLGENGLIIAGVNLAGNIAPLVPLGLLVPLVYRNMSWAKSMVLGVVTGLAIEISQTLLHVGIFDIDDVILNALGVMIGYAVFVFLAVSMRTRNYRNIVIAAIISIVACATVYATVIHPVSHQSVTLEENTNVLGDKEGEIPETGDLCGGTGGTGEIVSLQSGSIELKSKEGIAQTIFVSTKTDIRNSKGAISESDLKMGDYVTVVIFDEKEAAATILVCGA